MRPISIQVLGIVFKNFWVKFDLAIVVIVNLWPTLSNYFGAATAVMGFIYISIKTIIAYKDLKKNK